MRGLDAAQRNSYKQTSQQSGAEQSECMLHEVGLSTRHEPLGIDASVCRTGSAGHSSKGCGSKLDLVVAVTDVGMPLAMVMATAESATDGEGTLSRNRGC